MNQANLFRKAALDRLSSPEQLHTLMRITDAKGWLALAGAGLIVLTSLVWSVLGSVRTKVGASGILLGGGGLSEVIAEGEGDLVSIKVEEGAAVKKGDLVAEIEQPALVEQIANLKRRLDEIRQDIDAGMVGIAQSGRRDRLQDDLRRLEKQHEQGSRVLSSVDGRVVEIRSVVGEHLSAGRAIAAIERTGGAELEALLYFDSHVGKSLKPGMTIEVVPSVVQKERSGVLLGKVRLVDSYPSTRLGMIGALQNEQLVDSFLQSAGGAPIAVRAEILRDKTTPSGYRWSSGVGPDVQLTSGTPCTGAVITSTRHPIALVFPALDFGG